MTEKFIDDVIDHKESDIEKIQTKPNMYISYVGSRGSLHLAKELINNAIDECINEKSPGDMIDITLDEVTNTVTVSDNGRGIPEESLEVVCTTLQSGSKFDREGSLSSAGENGVGLTACNALSELFEIIVDRYGERSTITFHSGKKQGEIKKEKSPKTKHGTTFVMRPSRFYMEKDCDIISQDLIDWVERIHYLVPHSVKINLSINKKGKEAVVNKTFKHKKGLYDFVKKLTGGKKGATEPIHFVDKLYLKEKYRDKVFNRFMGLEVAFSYDQNDEEITTESFCNFVTTIDGGVHVEAVRVGLTQFFIKQAREMISERDMKKIENLTGNDVTQGLTLAVSLLTNYPPHFSGQTKEKLTNQDFFKPLQNMTHKALGEYFKVNPKDLKRIVDRIRVTALARVQSSKLRKSVIKGETTNFDEHMMKNFAPANNTGKNEYREILLIEGDSAMGSSRIGRFDKDTQALFALRGVPLNAYDVELAKVLENKEFKGLIQVLGCNVGDRFDISKLKYQKIIIMSDSDVDGFNITSLLCAFFMMHMPELVKGGYLYKAVAPLYKIKSKHKTYVLDKRELFKIHEKHVTESVKLVKVGTDVAYSNKELEHLLSRNEKYLKFMERAANHLSTNALLLEFILFHRHDKDFKYKLSKRYPEIEIDKNNVLTGIVDNKYQMLIMDEMFEYRVRKLNELIKWQISEGYDMYFDVYKKDSKGNYSNQGRMSLGEFLMMAQEFVPPIITRFKGLGELNPSELCDTTLDPNFRLIRQLTIDDMEKTMEQFDVLHGKNSDARKLLMQNFELDQDDLDN